MNFEFLFHPVEQVDLWLEGLFSGAPILAALGIALVLGLRHASDPDHLVAVTSLVAADGGDTRAIAIDLSYSERTVKNIVHDVLVKLDCSTRAQAVAVASRRGLL